MCINGIANDTHVLCEFLVPFKLRRDATIDTLTADALTALMKPSKLGWMALHVVATSSTNKVNSPSMIPSQWLWWLNA
jgi:hypothetical protein